MKKQKLHSQQTGPGIILESAPRNTILCLFTETKWQTSRGIPGFYSTSGVVDYTAVIFCAHLVAVKCEFFTTTSTREIQLRTRPATQLTRSPLLPADFTRQSIAHARKSKWKPNLSVHPFSLNFTSRTSCSLYGYILRRISQNGRSRTSGNS